MNDNADDVKIYSVTEINTEIKNALEDSYFDIAVCGEISGFKTYSSGHMYFNLKDENSQISVVMFAGFNKYLSFELKDGIQVIIYGKITTYLQRGNYQLQAVSVKQAGKGMLQEAFEKLKKKLDVEGLFDEANKKAVPYIVNKIGIATSKDGAALHDILSVINRRFSNIEVLIYPVRVQGEESKYEIVKAIEYFNNNYADLDVLLVGRGGGSLEDLWPFNEEIVARAIFNSEIPVISCVGHETDWTIADFVSDLRAPTPSAAAELVTKNKEDIKDKLLMLNKTLLSRMSAVISIAEEQIKWFAKCRALSKPHLIYEDKLRYIGECMEKLNNNFNSLVLSKENKLKLNIEKLNLLSPLNVLSRGYSVCVKENGQIVKTVRQVLENERLNVQLKEGRLNVIVKNNG